MNAHPIVLMVRLGVASIALCWLLASCGGVRPWVTRELVGQPSLSATKVPPRVVTPQSAASATSPFWLEDTELELNPGWAAGGTNLAWSHKGDQLAYQFGYSLWLAPDNKWSSPRKVYTVKPGAWPVSMESGDLVWSPGDGTIGLTLGRNAGSLEVPAEFYLGQVDWERQILSYLSLDQAVLIDWSPANRIVAWRDDSWWIYDVPTLTWDQVAIPQSISAKYYLRASRWATANFLLWLGDTDPYGKDSYIKGTFRDFAVFSLDWPSGEWEMLPISINSADVVLPYPIASPDGRWVAWLEDRGVYSRLMLYDRETGEQTQAASGRDYGQIKWGDLAWAPDSKRLAFSTEAANDEAQRHIIWILHLVPLK